MLSPAEEEIFDGWLAATAEKDMMRVPADRCLRPWWCDCAAWDDELGLTFNRIVGGEISENEHPTIAMKASR